jgi:16S rRNA (guanine527-N7)-methyltransferase
VIEREEQARTYCAHHLGSDAMNKLERLGSLLSSENDRQNLVAKASLAKVWTRHFADSAQLLQYVPHGTLPILDLGSGAGFPGLILALARPLQSVVLVESRRRRTEWLQSIAAELELRNCEVRSSRLEAMNNLEAGAITARAFAPLDKLLRLAARFSTPSTAWVLPKGRSAAQELIMQPPHVRAMFHVEQSETDPMGGILVGKGVPQLS